MLCLLFDVLRDCWTAKLSVIVHHLCLGQREISCMGIFTTKLLCLSVICSSVGLPFVCFFVWEDREGLRKGVQILMGTCYTQVRATRAEMVCVWVLSLAEAATSIISVAIKVCLSRQT